MTPPEAGGICRIDDQAARIRLRRSTSLEDIQPTQPDMGGVAPGCAGGSGVYVGWRELLGDMAQIGEIVVLEVAGCGHNNHGQNLFDHLIVEMPGSVCAGNDYDSAIVGTAMSRDEVLVFEAGEHLAECRRRSYGVTEELA